LLISPNFPPVTFGQLLLLLNSRCYIITFKTIIGNILVHFLLMISLNHYWRSRQVVRSFESMGLHNDKNGRIRYPSHLIHPGNHGHSKRSKFIHCHLSSSAFICGLESHGALPHRRILSGAQHSRRMQSAAQPQHPERSSAQSKDLS
jgi:hypothetical protein